MDRQSAFGQLTGDVNPIHLDRAVARRQLFGRRILHGLHGALRAWDTLLAGMQSPVTLTRVRGRFHAPVFPGEPVTLFLVEQRGRCAFLELRNASQVLYELELEWTPSGVGQEGDARVPEHRPPGTPVVRSLDELGNLTGSLPLYLDQALFASLFPRVAAAVPALQRAALCAVTRLVGMEAPGMQSLLSSFDLAFSGNQDTALDYQVTTVDQRFSLMRAEVWGGGITGTVEAFHRPLPVLQPSYESVRALARPGSFAGMTALVVGGSRGLGEVTAKLLAAGGARVIVTWYTLRPEAERVAREIRQDGSACDAIRWSALHPAEGATALAALGARPTHVFYFATPHIAGRKHAGFSRRRFRAFCRVYVEGLDATVRACRTGSGGLTVFVPSTVQLDHPLKGQAEYAAAKAAAEQQCRHLAATERNLTMIVRRLPRTQSDQSQSLLQQRSLAAVEVMQDALASVATAGPCQP